MPRIALVVSQNHDLPNTSATLADSPVALGGYLSLPKALSRGLLSARQREILALAIAQENGCQYSLSAHTEGAKAFGLSIANSLKARSGSNDCSDRARLGLFDKKHCSSARSHFRSGAGQRANGWNR